METFGTSESQNEASPFGTDEEEQSSNQGEGLEAIINKENDFNFDGTQLRRQFLNFLEFTVTDDLELDAKS